MAAARNAHHAPPASPPQLRASPVAHPPRALEEPDAAGFYQVRSRRRWRRRSPPMRSRPVPPALVGLCFNCLASSHVKADCVFPARCFNCRCEGHRAAACPLPPLGGKRRRPPSRSLLGRRVARRPDVRRPRPRDDDAADTTSARSVSTGRSPSIPRCCAAPTPPPPPPPGSPHARMGGVVVVPERTQAPDDAPARSSSMAAMAPVLQFDGRPARPRRTEFVVVPRTVELQATEDELGHALVAVVGGTRPPVSPSMVR
jgi:hypothetical protein